MPRLVFIRSVFLGVWIKLVARVLQFTNRVGKSIIKYTEHAVKTTIKADI
jgi:hypothetical protein